MINRSARAWAAFPSRVASGANAYRFHSIGAEIIAAILGLGLGMLVAAAACGTLATLTLIENHLHNLLVLAERDRRKQ